MDATPTNLSETDRRQVERLLTDARQQPTLAARMKLISARLLGLPYLKHSLIGSPTEPEQFVARLDGFDCVTYVETVLALSAATAIIAKPDRSNGRMERRASRLSGRVPCGPG